MNWPLFFGVWFALIGWALAVWYGTRIGYWKQIAADYKSFWEDERALNEALVRARDRQAVDEAEAIARQAVNRDA